MSSARIAAIALTTPFALATAQAPVTEKLGSVHFNTSCRATVAPQFDRAVALLHSFEFGESIRTFNAVFAADSNCAMAQWGIALSRWGNPMAAGLRSAEQLKPGRQAVDVAMRVAPRATDRERDYVRAVSQLYDDVEHKSQAERVTEYEHAMRDLVARQPADTEAKIFYAIALVAAASPTDKTYASQLKAGEILEPLWAKQPNHPGLAHYIIHTYDYPSLAGRARAAAERYASIAPSAAHALHMPSHTFTRVGMWEESIRANERSKATALETGAIAEALHASDYAMYANLQLGREAGAKAILDSLPTLAARFDPNVVTGAAPPLAAYFAIAAIPARWTLERSAWREAASLTPKPTSYPYCEAMTYFARALGAAHTNDLPRARSAVDSLGAIAKRLSASGDAYWAEQVAIQELGARAWLEFAEHHESNALAHLREAAVREDATEKNAVTPGPLAPARELLGDLLMALGRRNDARAEYRAVLQKEPNRRHSMLLAK